MYNMQVKDLMTKNVITCPENELLSQALSKMRKNNFHQLVVVDGKKVKGVVLVNDIVKKHFDADSTKVSSLMRPSPTLEKTASAEEASELIVTSDLKGIPITENGELTGIVSETDIINGIKIDFDVSEVAKECAYVTDSDSIGSVKNILVQKNVSRVPILKDGKLVGVVGAMELANIFEHSGKLKESRGAGANKQGYKEKINIDATSVATLMKEPTSLRQPVTAKKVTDLLKKNEQVFILNGNIKIITPKDVLKLIHTPKKMAYFQITGLEDEDAMTVAKIHKIIENAIRPIGKVNEIQSLKLYIEHHTKGGKTKYSIKVQLPTQLGVIVVSKVWNYNLITAMQEAMSNLDREFWKKHEKLVGREKASKRMARGK